MSHATCTLTGWLFQRLHTQYMNAAHVYGDNGYVPLSQFDLD